MRLSCFRHFISFCHDLCVWHTHTHAHKHIPPRSLCLIHHYIIIETLATADFSFLLFCCCCRYVAVFFVLLSEQFSVRCCLCNFAERKTFVCCRLCRWRRCHRRFSFSNLLFAFLLCKYISICVCVCMFFVHILLMWIFFWIGNHA